MKWHRRLCHSLERSEPVSATLHLYSVSKVYLAETGLLNAENWSAVQVCDATEVELTYKSRVHKKSLLST